MNKQYSDNNKPIVKGHVDGNVYGVIGAVCKTLRKAGYYTAANECQTRCLAADSYDGVLQIAQEYVDFEIDPS